MSCNDYYAECCDCCCPEPCNKSVSIRYKCGTNDCCCCSPGIIGGLSPTPPPPTGYGGWSVEPNTCVSITPPSSPVSPSCTCPSLITWQAVQIGGGVVCSGGVDMSCVPIGGCTICADKYGRSGYFSICCRGVCG